MSRTVSGKAVAIAIVVGLIVMAAIIIPNMLDRDQKVIAEKDIIEVIDTQYQAFQKEINEIVAKKEYATAIEKWKQFLKKFSYRNQYEKQIRKDIKTLEEKLNKNEN